MRKLAKGGVATITKRAPKGREPGALALRRLQRYFPQVKSVDDADEGLYISVVTADVLDAIPGDPEHCAFARACKRENIADGAIVGASYTWLINGTKATRYQTSPGIGREITSFDRHKDFAAGENYRLGRVSETKRMGARPGRPHGGPTGRGAAAKPRLVHRTARIRQLWKV